MADEKVDGLTWLMRRRGGAMRHLLRFLGESRKHLDDKTAFLLYVMMGTINFSPRSLRQYIPKAHEAGASVDEIIDTVLVSYPAAGLNKVVDALAILSELNLEEAPQTVATDGGEVSSAPEAV